MNHEFVFEPVVQFAVSVFEIPSCSFDFSPKKCPEQLCIATSYKINLKTLNLALGEPQAAFLSYWKMLEPRLKEMHFNLSMLGSNILPLLK